jgi:hypothetical protein
MKTKETHTEKLVKVSESGLLSLVADKIKGRVLFPEKIEDAKQYVKHVKNNPFK